MYALLFDIIFTTARTVFFFREQITWNQCALVLAVVKGIRPPPTAVAYEHVIVKFCVQKT